MSKPKCVLHCVSAAQLFLADLADGWVKEGKHFQADVIVKSNGKTNHDGKHEFHGSLRDAKNLCLDVRTGVALQLFQVLIVEAKGNHLVRDFQPFYVPGSTWRSVGRERPWHGNECTNVALAEALLQQQQEFVSAEVKAFELEGVEDDSFIRAGDEYFVHDPQRNCVARPWMDWYLIPGFPAKGPRKIDVYRSTTGRSQRTHIKKAAQTAGVLLRKGVATHLRRRRSHQVGASKRASKNITHSPLRALKHAPRS